MQKGEKSDRENGKSREIDVLYLIYVQLSSTCCQTKMLSQDFVWQ